MNGIVRSRHRGIPAQDGAGVKLTRIINQPSLRHQDPFLMLDEFRSDNPNDYIAGFPPHPHRGFVTLTYMLAGQMAHEDSEGNSGVVGAGGAQWMKAARGIIHGEMPKQEDGLMWGFQLWINLPAAEKMSPAEWADHPEHSVPKIVYGDSEIRLIAGELEGNRGPVQQQGQRFLMADLRFSDNTAIPVTSAGQASRMAYVYQGSVRINGESVERGELVRLDADSNLTISAAAVPAGVILLAGEPIGEPIAQYGPFVMNTQAEIEQAIRDYQQGRLTG